MWTAFPSADYYGGSVAVGLAPRRRSRVSHVARRLERDVGAPFVPLSEVVPRRPPARKRSADDFCPRRIPVASPLRRCDRGDVRLHRWETGVQAIQLSPYRAGLAEPRPSASSGRLRFDGMLVSLLAFAAR